jgi:hypothetical protein
MPVIVGNKRKRKDCGKTEETEDFPSLKPVKNINYARSSRRSLLPQQRTK